MKTNEAKTWYEMGGESVVEQVFSLKTQWKFQKALIQTESK